MPSICFCLCSLKIAGESYNELGRSVPALIWCGVIAWKMSLF